MARESGILIIATGGNVCLFATKEGGADVLKQASAHQIKLILGISDDQEMLRFRERSIVPQDLPIQFEDIRNEHGDFADPELLDSAQVDPRLWSRLATLINRKYSDYEGFVILHGLDTMAYTASALSFMLGNLDKPIVLTGAQRPLNYRRTDAVQNIMSAVTFAGAKTLGLDPIIREVTVYSYDTLFRGNRVSMVNASSYRCFDTSNYPALAAMGANTEIQTHLIRSHRASSRPLHRKHTSAEVIILDVFPGMKSEILQSIYRANQRLKNGKPVDPPDDEVAEPKLERKDSPVAGILLRTYGMGTAPTDSAFLAALEQLVKDKVLIVNVTQARSGRISKGDDPISLRLFERGVVSGVDMTSEAAYSKMVVLLSEGKKVEEVADLMQLDHSGEQSQSIFTFHYGEGMTEVQPREKTASVTLEPQRDVLERHILEHESTKIRYIQLKILGLQLDPPPPAPVNRVVTFDAYLVDEGMTVPLVVDELKRQQALTWSLHGRPTINIAFDITNSLKNLLSPGTLLKIDTWEPVRWKHLMIEIYAETSS